MFVGLHATLAVMTKTPELAITEQEGRDFTKSAQNVLRHYSVQTTQKTLDWLAFMGVTAGMYGTRAFAISMRKGAEKAANPTERGQVLQWPKHPRSRPAAEAAAPSVEMPAGAPPSYVPSVVPGDPDGESGF